MPYITEWGKELAKLSDNDFDFLISDEIKKFIAMEGRVERLEQAGDLMKSLISGYNPSHVLREDKGKICFNSILCLHQVSLYIELLSGNPLNNVIELGAGFGNFSRIFRQYVEVFQYEIFDIPIMSRFAKKFLREHFLQTLIFNSATDIEYAHATNYDLFISNICMSEMPQEWRQEVVDRIWPNCKTLFVIDGDSNNKAFDVWLEEQIKKHFSTVKITPFKYLWEGQNVYVARKKL
jgi:protein-L-isoaspartate O-methyltransferase